MATDRRAFSYAAEGVSRMNETSSPALDLILDRVKEGLPFSATLVAQVVATDTSAEISKDEVCRYRNLEDWIFSKGYESLPVAGSIHYRKKVLQRRVEARLVT